jgi:hypothetical protein
MGMGFSFVGLIIGARPASRNVPLRGTDMFEEEQTFTVRISLEATFPDEYEGDDDNHAWAQEWERLIKPELLRVIFDTLRRHPTWTIHARNRGRAPQDEVEIVMVKDFSKPVHGLN